MNKYIIDDFRLTIYKDFLHKSVMLNVAVIGAGEWGKNHIRIYNNMNTVNLSLVADLDKNLTKNVSENFNVTTTNDINDVITNNKIDAVNICTPASTHFEIAKKCLESGKSVLIEKPISMNSKDATELISIAEKNGKTILSGHTFRYDPNIEKAIELRKSGLFGNIFYLSLSRMGLKKPRNDCGVIFNYAVHDFDIMTNFLGQEFPKEITTVVSHNLGRPIEDFAFISAKFENNVLGYCQVSWLTPAKIRDFWIVGEKSSAFVDSMKNEIDVFDCGIYPEYNDFGTYKLITREGKNYKINVDKKEPLQEELKDFIKCVETGKKPVSDANTGMNVIKILEAAQISAKINKTIKLDKNGDII